MVALSRIEKMAVGVIVGISISKQIAVHQQDLGMVGHVADFVRSLKAAMVTI